MRVAYCSDLHLDVGPNPINPEFFNVPADVLIMAGDIVEAKDAKHYHDFFSRVAETWKTVIYVMGNHEFYRGYIPKSQVKLSEELDKYGFIFLENETVEIDDIQFIGATLWTDFHRENPITMQVVGNYMNDYLGSIRMSNKGYRKFLPIDALTIHKRSKAYIEETLKNGKKSVVVTHHAPSHLSIDSRYKNMHHENGGYYSDLSNLILDNPNLKFWAHGHCHSKFDYVIGDCNVLCNPRGYNGERPRLLPPYQPATFEV